MKMKGHLRPSHKRTRIQDTPSASKIWYYVAGVTKSRALPCFDGPHEERSEAESIGFQQCSSYEIIESSHYARAMAIQEYKHGKGMEVGFDATLRPHRRLSEKTKGQDEASVSYEEAWE